MFDAIDFKPSLPKGDIWGTSHWEQIQYARDGYLVDGVRDKSTGEIYNNTLGDTPMIRRVKALVVIATSIPYLVACIAFHAFRFIAASIYLTCKPTKDHTITTEAKLAGKNILRSFPYWFCYTASACYMLYDTRNGAKLVAHYEKRWNHGVSIEESIHLTEIRKHFGEKPEHSFGIFNDWHWYGPGCFQPVAVAHEDEDAVFKLPDSPQVRQLGTIYWRQPNPIWTDFKSPFKGSYVGNDHVKWVSYGEGETSHSGWIDTDTNIVYNPQGCVETWVISLACMVATPIEVVWTVAYNALRIVPVVLYILAKMCTQKIEQGKHTYTFTDIYTQVELSICNIIRAPLYGTALMFGYLYALVSPFNGRKVVADLEKQWNRDQPLEKGRWLTMRAMDPNWSEVNGEIGMTILYIPGCFQPIGKRDEDEKTISSRQGNAKFDIRPPYQKIHSCLA